MPFEDHTLESRAGQPTQSAENVTLHPSGSKLDIGAVMKEAWAMVPSSQVPYITAFVIGLITVLLLNFILGAVLVPKVPDPWSMTGTEVGRFGAFTIINSVISQTIQLIFIGGLYVMAIRHVNKLEINPKNILGVMPKVIPLFIASLAVTVLTLLGFTLLILPGIYLSVAYIFVLPLTIDRNLTTWDALETSRKVVTSEWFSYFFLCIIVGVVTMLSALPILIGLFWTVPWALNVFGILYRNNFGIQDVRNMA